MKKTTLVSTLLLALSCAGRIYGEAVTLGGTSFDATSDQISTNWFMPMLPGTTSTFSGTGANAGQTKIESYSLGDTVSGVKAVKRHIEGSSPAVASEDWWIARDAGDDLRLLKLIRGGAVVFEASAATAPLLYMPGTPTEGKTWDFLGTAVTMEWVVLSKSGIRLKIRESSSGQLGGGADGVVTYFESGKGITQAEADSGAGWKLNAQ